MTQPKQSLENKFKSLQKRKNRYFRPSFSHWFDEDDLIQEVALRHLEKKCNINYYKRARYSVMRDWLQARDIMQSKERFKSDAQFAEQSYNFYESDPWMMDKIEKSGIGFYERIIIKMLMHGYNQSDIAKTLDVSEARITQRMKYVKRTIKELMNDKVVLSYSEPHQDTAKLNSQKYP